MGKVYTRFQTKTSQKPYPICVVRVAVEVAGGRENGRARGRHACLLLSRAFFLVATISKRLLRRLDMRWGGTYLYSLYKGVPPPPPSEAADHHDHLGPFRSFKFHLKWSLPWCMLHSKPKSTTSSGSMSVQKVDVHWELVNRASLVPQILIFERKLSPKKNLHKRGQFVPSSPSSIRGFKIYPL